VAFSTDLGERGWTEVVDANEGVALDQESGFGIKRVTLSQHPIQCLRMQKNGLAL